MSILSSVLAGEPLLRRAEVVELARQIEAGVLARDARLSGRDVGATAEELRALEEIGAAAWQRFVRANLRLVAMVASSAAARTRLPEADLFQEGCLGLMTAIQRYDHTRGYTFATYAMFWIRSFVGAGSARQLGALNLPASRAEQLRAARGMETELAQHLGRAPTTAELAEALGRPERWTAALLRHQAPQSMDGLEASLGGSVTIHGPIPDADPDAEVAALLRVLAAPEREVLELRLGFTDAGPCTLAATARRLGFTVTRVRKLEEQALETLRSVCPQSAIGYLE